MEITEIIIKTAKRKRLTLITRDRVTTLLFTSLVVAKTKIEEIIKMGMKKYLSIVPPARIFTALVLGNILPGDKLQL
jgi:hypothetical protein